MYRQGLGRSQNKIPRFRSPRGRERGQSRGRADSHNPYMMSRNIKYNVQPEAKVYSKEAYNNLTPNQKGQVLALKNRNGWINACTPPPGFQISKTTGEAQTNNLLVSTIRAAASTMIQEDSS